MLNNTETVAEFLARGGRVTRVAPAAGRAKSLRNLNKVAEEAAEMLGEMPNVIARRAGVLVNPDAVRVEAAKEAARLRVAVEARAAYVEARAAGFSEAEAIEYAS